MAKMFVKKGPTLYKKSVQNLAENFTWKKGAKLEEEKTVQNLEPVQLQPPTPSPMHFEG